MRFVPRRSTALARGSADFFRKTNGLRILFSVRNPSYVRYYDSVLRGLAARGHEVELTSEFGNVSFADGSAGSLTISTNSGAVDLESV